MKVFKFGGASVKDAEGVRNVFRILESFKDSKLLVVISAMGKTTNALERIVDLYFAKGNTVNDDIDVLKRFHVDIASDIFDNHHDVFDLIQGIIDDLLATLKRNKSTQYDFVYDQIVSYGELLSTTIVSAYLNLNGLENIYVDARELIKTDTTHRDAKVDWETTQNLIKSNLPEHKLIITQGFIGSDVNNFTTTLGREGSDYSAGIFAYCLNAESVSIWKDVPGVLNADPRVFEETHLLHHISYGEAIELAFYGASVIHPKTLQPLQRKEIPLFVKSFQNPEEEGTSVKKGQPLDPYIPCFIVKKNQILLSLSSLDFSFIVEDNISQIFSLFHKYQIKVDLIQNSAISFSVCLDDRFSHFEKLLPELKTKFKISYNQNVDLYTIRHFNELAIKQLEKDKEVFLKQITRETCQIVGRYRKN